MLVVKIEMWPKGDHTRARDLGVASIVNVGGDAEIGEYECRLFKSPEYSRTAGRTPLHKRLTRPTARETWRKGVVFDFPRARLGPWDLLFRALGELVSDRSTGVQFNAEVRGDTFGGNAFEGDAATAEAHDWADAMEDLYLAIEHGDDKHRAWLHDKLLTWAADYTAKENTARAAEGTHGR